MDKAPLSKSLLLVPSAISILLTLLFQHYQKFFAYNLQAIKEDFQASNISKPPRRVCEREAVSTIEKSRVRDHLTQLYTYKLMGDWLPLRVPKELEIIFERSWQLVETPNDWRKANITPFFGKGRKGDSGNIRPLSLTLVPRKAMEQIFLEAMSQHMQDTKGWIRKAKAHLELNLTKDVKGKKKGFYRNISKRKTKKKMWACCCMGMGTWKQKTWERLRYPVVVLPQFFSSKTCFQQSQAPEISAKVWSNKVLNSVKEDQAREHLN
ncbi:hypothetical protein QYF61_020623 [Mycteria americana]|uniref:Uncharacterized protein n=1 Tax=Mycteria americana TaxID=33587 RepID=A0AAN7S9Q2_MYCAM|nr:hypothetical protein QYF61_020623 [Mycteria americana]